MNNNELIHLLKKAAAKQLPYVLDEELIHKTLYWLAAERIEELEKKVESLEEVDALQSEIYDLKSLKEGD